MANKDMNISMKFTADVNRTKKNIQEVVEAINHEKQAISDLLKVEQTETKTQESAAKAAKKHKKEVEKLRQGLDQLLGSIDPVNKGLSRLDELESKLRKSKKAGVIDDETFNDYLGKINNQRAALSTDESQNEGAKKLILNAMEVRRTIADMIKQLENGNFSGAVNSLFSIGNVTGKLPPQFRAATLSVVGFIEAAYGIARVLSSILSEQEAFEKSIISTGNYAGTTASNLEVMSQKIGSIGHNYSETRENIAQLTQQGQLSAESIENIGTAAAYMTALTGQSSKEAY